MGKLFRYSLITLFLLSANLYGDDDGFDDEEEKIEAVSVKKESANDFTAYGSLSLSSSYNYSHDKPTNNQNDFRGFSSLKLSTNINLEKKFGDNYKLKSTIKAYQDFIYDLKDDEYSQIPKDYDKDFDINELYLQGKNKNIDFRVGRQIVVWGKSDNIRITDVLNPIDNTTPGMVDIKDLRLGRAMSKVDYYLGSWALNGILLHENRFTKNPKYGSDFRPKPDQSTNEPSSSLKNSGVALSLSGNFTGQDIAFYYANQYFDKPYLQNGILEYKKSNMYGFAYNRVVDKFLLKTELAYFDNIRYTSTTDTKKRVDMLLGVEFTGISDGSISFEVANKHIFDYESALYSSADTYLKEDEMQYAIRYTQSFINQTLDFTILATLFGEEMRDGGFVRSWIDYDINDKLSTSFGFINYIGGDKPNWESMKDNDRVFASLKYSF